MKYCVYCGKQLDDKASFCFACGKQVADVSAPAPVAPDDVLRAEEAACLDKSYRMFKFERLVWKIFGFVWLASIIFLVLAGVLMLALNSVVGELPPEATMEIFDEMPYGLHGILFALYGVAYILMGVLYIPVMIVNFKMVKRAEYYMDTVYTDTAGAVKRAGAVGMIVLSALFNTVAMIFIIINFVHVKNNRAVFDRIIARQQTEE